MITAIFPVKERLDFHQGARVRRMEEFLCVHICVTSPGLFPIRIPKISMLSLVQSRPSGLSLLPIFRPSQIALVLRGLTRAPETRSKELSDLKSEKMDLSPIRREVRSSANCDSLISNVLMTKPLMSGFSLIRAVRASEKRTYSIGDNGHPCLTPLSTEKLSLYVPFTLTRDEMFVYRSLIQAMYSGLKFILRRILKRKFHETLSNAFI